MEWASPWAFWLLIPVLALPLQRWITGVNRLAVARSESMERKLSVRLLLAWLPGLLRFVGLVLLVLALARPRVTTREVTVESDGLDIMMAIDTSCSMEQEDFQQGLRQTNRLEVAKGVMADFVQGRPYDRIGVVVFGEEAFTQVPLTVDHDTLIAVLEQVQIGVAGGSGTAIGQALAVSSKRLKDLDAPSRIVILLTDGRNNAGRISPMESSQAAEALGIRVYTVGVGGGGRGSWLNPFGGGVDERTLTEMAKTTGGQYFGATDTGSLQKIFSVIDELEPSPAEVKELYDYDEKFKLFLLPGLVALLLQLVLSSTWLRRGP